MVKRSRKHRGGIRGNTVIQIMEQTGDLNRFYNYYLEKASEGMPSAVASDVPIGPGITNSIMVIDMQNDFVLPHPEGKFSVAGGIHLTDPLASWIQENAGKCTKVVFSRDSHDPDHCSFLSRSGPFPPHCQINSTGSEMHPSMMKFSTLGNAAVIFKGMDANVDSFGAFRYPDDAYSVLRQTGDHCCTVSKALGSLGECADATGGFYLDNITTEMAFGPRPFLPGWVMHKRPFQLTDLLKGNEIQHNIFIVGLAGDYCVRDTAINIAKIGQVNGVKLNVFVIQPFIRYAFVPMFVGQPSISTSNLAEEKTNGVRKSLTKYAFRLGESGFEIVSASEAKSIKNAELPNYFHFLTDPREIVQNYNAAGVKILLNIPNLNRQIVGKKTRSKSRRI